MNCDKFEEMIALYVEGELSGADKQALELHIEKCSKCKEQLQALSYMREIMGRTEEKAISLPRNLKKKIYFKIYRDLLIMFAGLVIIISVVAISGGLVQMFLSDKTPAGIKALLTGGMLLLVSGLIVLLYDVFVDMLKILMKK